jgi:hypothetical protein
MKSKVSVTLSSVSIFLVMVTIVVSFIGWILNLINVINSNETLATLTLKGILQVVGIFVVPLGSLLGWIV